MGEDPAPRKKRLTQASASPCCPYPRTKQEDIQRKGYPGRGWCQARVGSSLRAALHPFPAPQAPPKLGQAHPPPPFSITVQILRLFPGHQRGLCVGRVPSPCTPPPASSAPIRNRPAWERLSWEPAADSDPGTLPSLPSASPPWPAPSLPAPRKPGKGWATERPLKGPGCSLGQGSQGGTRVWVPSQDSRTWRGPHTRQGWRPAQTKWEQPMRWP